MHADESHSLSAQVHRLCEYAGRLPTGPFMEFFSELPSDMLGLLKWLQLRPRHAPLLNTLMDIMESSPETNRGHQVNGFPCTEIAMLCGNLCSLPLVLQHRSHVARFAQ